jgi:hypothetical protein
MCLATVLVDDLGLIIMAGNTGQTGQIVIVVF